MENRLIFQFGWMLREGQIAIDLLRPLDFQARFYVDAHSAHATLPSLSLPLAAAVRQVTAIESYPAAVADLRTAGVTWR